MTPILPASVRGFSDYFKSTYETKDIVQAFGYRYVVEAVNFALSTRASEDWATALQTRLADVVATFGLRDEQARREFLIAPILLEIGLRYKQIRVQTRYPIRVSEQLHGSLDCLLRTR